MTEPYKSGVTIEDVEGKDPLDEILDKAGATAALAALRLKEGLDAKVTKTVKIGGNVGKTLDSNVRILAKSGPQLNVPGGENFDPLEDPGQPLLVTDTLLAIDEVSHDIRLRSSIEVMKMRGHYANKGEDKATMVNIQLVSYSDEDYTDDEKAGRKNTE